MKHNTVVIIQYDERGDPYYADIKTGERLEGMLPLPPPKRTCNVCGLSCALNGRGVDNPDVPHGLLDASVSGGWDSTPGNGAGALDDLTSYSFNLCEFCCDWLFTAMRIPPRCSDHGGGSVAFKPAAQRVADDDRAWKSEFASEKARRDAARSGK